MTAPYRVEVKSLERFWVCCGEVERCLRPIFVQLNQEPIGVPVDAARDDALTRLFTNALDHWGSVPGFWVSRLPSVRPGNT